MMGHVIRDRSSEPDTSYFAPKNAKSGKNGWNSDARTINSSEALQIVSVRSQEDEIRKKEDSCPSSQSRPEPVLAVRVSH
jgi:hypothetical protein